MLAVVHAILCWGDEFTGKHIIFHIDNEAIFDALTKFSIRSPPTLLLLRHFLALSCWLDFTFGTTWLSSKDNAIADAASRFAYRRLFELAPYLDHNPSSKQLRLLPSSPHPTARPHHIAFAKDRRPRHTVASTVLRATAPPFIPSHIPFLSPLPIYTSQFDAPSFLTHPHTLQPSQSSPQSESVFAPKHRFPSSLDNTHLPSKHLKQPHLTSQTPTHSTWLILSSSLPILWLFSTPSHSWLESDPFGQTRELWTQIKFVPNSLGLPSISLVLLPLSQEATKVNWWAICEGGDCPGLTGERMTGRPCGLISLCLCPLRRERALSHSTYKYLRAAVATLRRLTLR
jgi:hypothetical protein